MHLGSLLAATASYLDARVEGLAWRLRFDDLDEPRNQPGAEADILRALERHGLRWDGAVERQSAGLERYHAALARLAERGLLFHCRCSRRELAGRAIYPGTCRRHLTPRPDSAVRVRVHDAVIEFDDLLQGHQRLPLAQAGGDFVVRRRDGIFAYQLATAVDDGDPRIVRVIRGRDLLESTPRQIYLMRCLELPVPAYGHLPLLLNPAGQKLSKQTRAAPLNVSRPQDNLLRVLAPLGVVMEDEFRAEPCERLLAAAAARFSLRGIPRRDTRVGADTP